MTVKLKMKIYTWAGPFEIGPSVAYYGHDEDWRANGQGGTEIQQTPRWRQKTQSTRLSRA